MCSRKSMRRRASIAFVLGLIAAALAWVAAPALSLRPYMAGGVDFEQGIPVAKRMAPAATAAARSAHPGEKPPRWISPTIDAPHRFDLVGVAREMRAVQIRVRDDGGRWSNWVEQDDGT